MNKDMEMAPEPVPMGRYSKLGYVAFNVTDLDKSTDFYRDQVGLQPSGQGPGGESLFRCTTDRHNVVLCKGDIPGMKRAGWEMENEEELDRMRHRFLQAEIPVVDVPAEESKAWHQGRSFRVSMPYTGATFEYYSEIGSYASEFKPTVAKIMGLGHIVLRATNLPEAHRIASDVFNFRTSDIIAGAANFYRCFPNPYHHSFAMAAGSKHLFHHLNFMVSEIDDIGKAIHRLNKAKAPIVYGPGRHPGSGSVFLYFLDPDGITLEFSFGMEEFEEERPRKHRLLEPVADSGDTWGAPMDPRMAATGALEPLFAEAPARETA